MPVNTTLGMTVGASVSFQYQSDPPGLQPSSNFNADAKSVAYEEGIGAGQSDQPYAAVLNIAAGGYNTIVLTNGSVNDPLNIAVSAVRLKSGYVRLLGVNDTAPDGVTAGTNATSITMSGANGNVAQGGFFDGTNPKPRIWNSGPPLTFGSVTAQGLNTNLTLNFANEDATNAAVVLVVLGLGTT